MMIDQLLIEKLWIVSVKLLKRFCSFHQVPMQAWNTNPIRMQSLIDHHFEMHRHGSPATIDKAVIRKLHHRRLQIVARVTAPVRGLKWKIDAIAIGHGVNLVQQYYSNIINSTHS